MQQLLQNQEDVSWQMHFISDKEDATWNHIISEILSKL